MPRFFLTRHKVIETTSVSCENTQHAKDASPMPSFNTPTFNFARLDGVCLQNNFDYRWCGCPNDLAQPCQRCVYLEPKNSCISTKTILNPTELVIRVGTIVCVSRGPAPPLLGIKNVRGKVVPQGVNCDGTYNVLLDRRVQDAMELSLFDDVPASSAAAPAEIIFDVESKDITLDHMATLNVWGRRHTLARGLVRYPPTFVETMVEHTPATTKNSMRNRYLCPPKPAISQMHPEKATEAIGQTWEQHTCHCAAPVASDVHRDMHFKAWVPDGFIWSGEGNKCWYKQHEEESSYFSGGEISGNIGVLIFDDSNCMSEDSMGLGHMLNIKMINQLVSKWYSRDGEFKTKENELYGSSLFQEKGKYFFQNRHN